MPMVERSVRHESWPVSVVPVIEHECHNECFESGCIE